MSSYEVRAIKFIHQVFDYISDCKQVSDYYGAISDFNAHNSRKVQCANGMTRVAFITSDYVIKFDYSDYYTKRWGGCEQEYKLYNAARADGYGYLFAKIKPYYYQGRVFYIMPRINGIGRTWYNADSYMTWEEREWCDDHDLRDLHNENYGWHRKQIVICDYAANSFRYT